MSTMDHNAAFTQLLLNRRNLYHLFSRLFQAEIDGALYAHLPKIVFPTHLMEGDLTEFQTALLRLNDYFASDGGETLDDLAADYAKTFLGAGSAQGAAAFPYESVYTSPKHVMMQDAWNQVCELYAYKGIERAEAADGLLEDHIAVELDFMAYLCDEAAQLTEPLAVLEDQNSFLNRHLLNWVPKFCLDIAEYADTEFYRMVGQLTAAFLQLDSRILDQMIVGRKTRAIPPQRFSMTRQRMNALLAQLQGAYHIYAPKQVSDWGTQETADLIRYQEIGTLEEIALNRQCDFSLKEIIYPVSQTIFQFDENQCTETATCDPKGIIVFARPCDINGLKRLDNLFLANGGTSDAYYKRMRDRVSIFMMECPQSWENCYCVSMGTNKTETYSAAVRLHSDSIELEVKDIDFLGYFGGETPSDYHPTFIEANARTVRIPAIADSAHLREIYNLELWKECSKDCVSCGGCNTVCPTCSCFDTVDILHQENSRKGERKRVWSSCMMADFSKTAGGNIARKLPEQMMRFKTMHKVYDYNARFGGNEHMCVGCGRCIQQCQKDISFADTVNRLANEVDALNARV